MYNKCKLDPDEIRYTQDSISKNFNNGSHKWFNNCNEEITMKENINDFVNKLFNADFLLQTYRQFLEDPDIIEHSIIPEYCKFEGNFGNCRAR